MLFGGASWGLCSSRIDFVLPSKLNGLGLFFLSVFELVVRTSVSADASDACDFERPLACLLESDLSLWDSA